MEHDPENLLIEYEYFMEPSPSTACGTYDGLTFEFYARWDSFTFIISLDPEVSAFDIDDIGLYDLEATQKSEHPFPQKWVKAFEGAFYIERDYGERGSYKASLYVEGREDAYHKRARWAF